MKSDARKRFLEVGLVNSVKAQENFEAYMALAKAIIDAEAVGFKLDPDSVEKAVKNVLGVESK